MKESLYNKVYTIIISASYQESCVKMWYVFVIKLLSFPFLFVKKIKKNAASCLVRINFIVYSSLYENSTEIWLGRVGSISVLFF